MLRVEETFRESETLLYVEMARKPSIVKTREILGNRKIPVPPEVLDILTGSGQKRSVCWNIHLDTGTVVLSSKPVVKESYELVGLTDVTDGGRYIRPPSDLPDKILEEMNPEEVTTGELLSDLYDKEVEDIRKGLVGGGANLLGGSLDSDIVEERLAEPVKNSVTFVVYDSMVVGDVKQVLLMTKSQMRDRMPSVSGIFRRQEDVLSLDPFDIPKWREVSTDSSGHLS